MTNEERWDAFLSELKAYIEEDHLCPPKHTTLRNQVVYFRRKMRDGKLDKEKARLLEEVLNMRDLTIHTGGRKKSIRQAQEPTSPLHRLSCYWISKCLALVCVF